jgi:hypothetical protein
MSGYSVSRDDAITPQPMRRRPEALIDDSGPLISRNSG